MTRNLLLLSMGLIVSAPCFANAIAVAPGTGGTENNAWNFTATIGWQFTLSSPVTVVQLGFFDGQGSAGLADSHPVGIFDSTGTLLVSATVPSGPAGTLLDGFEFVNVAPTVLGPGSYTIGGQGNGTSTDQFEFGLTGSTAIPGLTLGSAVVNSSAQNTLSFPNVQASSFSQGYFGPDFVVLTVPEPSAIILLAMALSLLGSVQASRRREAKAV